MTRIVCRKFYIKNEPNETKKKLLMIKMKKIDNKNDLQTASQSVFLALREIMIIKLSDQSQEEVGLKFFWKTECYILYSETYSTALEKVLSCPGFYAGTQAIMNYK